mgnify:CR=1 FL=1
MPIYAIDGKAPDFADRAGNWIAPDAVVIGNVRIGRNVGIWFGTVIRGDNELISATDDELRRFPTWVSSRNLDNQASDASVDAVTGSAPPSTELVGSP